MKLYSTADIARLIGIPESKLVYEHRSGRLDGPENIVGGIRIYSEADLKRVADHFSTLGHSVPTTK